MRDPAFEQLDVSVKSKNCDGKRDRNEDRGYAHGNGKPIFAPPDQTEEQKAAIDFQIAADGKQQSAQPCGADRHAEHDQREINDVVVVRAKIPAELIFRHQHGGERDQQASPVRRRAAQSDPGPQHGGERRRLQQHPETERHHQRERR
ncbi:MAG: hypothetical protein WCI56_14015 [Hyphomicrobiales bacterium]